MTLPIKLYLSGPMSDMPEHNFPAFHRAAMQLRAMGHIVVNPAEIDHGPHATWSDCLRGDLPHLVRCDAIALLPAWNRSKGARLELHVALELGMPVFTLAELIERHAQA